MRAVTPSSSGSAFRSSSSSFSSAAAIPFSILGYSDSTASACEVCTAHAAKKKKQQYEYCCRAPAQTRSVFHAGQAHKQPQKCGPVLDRTTAKLQPTHTRGRLVQSLITAFFLYFYIFQNYFLQKYIFGFIIYSFVSLPSGCGAAGPCRAEGT